MAIITPNAGLLLTYVIVAIFSMWMLVNPIQLLEQYKIDFTNTTSTDKLLVSGTVQLIGIWYAMAAGALTITARNGTDAQKSMLCFMTGVWSVVSIISNLMSISHYSTIGVPATGAYFNSGLNVVVGAVCFLGAECPPSINMAPVKKPLYWGYIASIIVTAFFMLYMFFGPEHMMASYGVELGSHAQTLIVGFLKFVWAPWDLYVILIFLTQLLVTGPCATYGYSRWMCCVEMALMCVSAIGAVVWQCLNENGKYDKLIAGSYFNLVLYLMFFFFFYAPVALLDPPVVKDNIEKEIGKEDDEDEGDEEEEEPEKAEKEEPLMPVGAPMPMAVNSTAVPTYAMPTAYTTAPPTTAYAYSPAAGTVV